ncbi:hypothetical protein STAS_10614 [Striga asiatica]|uniref:Uncharacterized protein n=1 Tax=Striga asiatica TaxID=4170 RepID=A0A5A7PNP9_STRAF|nr:hypothetical protein STAS_10614 [Striga asiatica]
MSKQPGGDGMHGGGGGGGGRGDGGGDRKRKGIATEVDDDFLISSEDEEEEREDRVQVRRTSLDSLSSLEDALPVNMSIDNLNWFDSLTELAFNYRKGLSGHYSGKAKSFGSLTELGVNDPMELGKKEHPINKRRRLLIAHEMREQEKLGASSASATPLSGDQKEDEDEENKVEDRENEAPEDDHDN